MFDSRTLALTAIALALAGCAGPAPEAWRVEPNYRVSHAAPGMAPGYAALARQYEGERRWSDALQAWRRAAAQAPGDVDVLDALGVALAGQGHHEEAVAVLRQAVALAPQRARLHNNLGYALILAGRDDEARDPLRTAVLLDPAHAMARANLQRVAPAVEPAIAAAAPAAVVDAAPATPAAPAATQVQTEPTIAPLQVVREAAVAAEPEAPPPLPQPARLQGLRVEIANGNGITGMAAWVSGWLQQRGLGSRARLTNLLPYAEPATVVYYRSGFAAEAQEIASRMPLPAALAEQPAGPSRSDVRVVLGHDLREQVALAVNHATPR
ncbi:LytR C-terminal domain-containing protein [Methylibium rhizosphaerae]|uniref:LytR C-terminal domain-containing protein n=1 Tax=Methylibium rhizosphaerae TaxID=2570323 RepID=UPI0015E496D3|nr:LytR C-terminal domain-containing protein [Methylibium rhizosphaerae]